MKNFRTFIVVSNPKNRSIITSQTVNRRGCRNSLDFYKKIDRIEVELENKYPNARVFTGRASSLDAFLNIFPEATLGEE